MDQNILFYCIIAILAAQYLMDTVLDHYNMTAFAKPLPGELSDVLNETAHEKARAYHNDNYRFGLLKDGIAILGLLLFLGFGGFRYVDNQVATLTDNPILQALFFFGILLIASNLLSLPFSYYSTFTIEAKYGFNKTNKRLFFTDLLKSGILSLVIGGGILALTIWFLEVMGTYFWLYVWGFAILLTVFLNFFFSTLLVPLFNKQTPLSAGGLKSDIQAYAQKVGFDLSNVFVIDGSKRSTKANAYFSGFGMQKRVTLYDTLIADLEKEEIVAVLAHEVGHYKEKHIVFNLFLSIALTGLLLYILSLFINNADMAMAIGVQRPSYHAGLLSFMLLYSPISLVTGLAMKVLSRKFEFQADNFAKATFASEPLVNALKKLSKNSLSHPTPHPAYVFVHYSHPPLIARIRNLMT
ncbi:MAG: M48 family metallopeptidase [Bacteroidota bacterium]